jgi:hypothetical protein
MKMEQTVFRNVGIYNSGAGELPRRKHTTYRTRQKFEIKNVYIVFTSTLRIEFGAGIRDWWAGAHMHMHTHTHTHTHTYTYTHRVRFPWKLTTRLLVNYIKLRMLLSEWKIGIIKFACYNLSTEASYFYNIYWNFLVPRGRCRHIGIIWKKDKTDSFHIPTHSSTCHSRILCRNLMAGVLNTKQACTPWRVLYNYIYRIFQ